ncbi:MAG: hypothetical protein JJU00_12745 [Opitutales bacterium]|nr:hypothetical protein [Opitutales bacterium]
MALKILTVTADDRERGSAVFRALGKTDGIELRWERMSRGDYLIDDGFLFERKTAADFSRSLLDGRLFAQAGRLLETPYRPAYLLEGSAAQWRDLGVRREALQGALVTLMMVFDLPVFRALGAEEAARIMVYAGRQRMRLRTDAAPAYRVAKAKRRRTRQQRLLQALPGVGRDRALRLLDHFGSVSACLSAGPEELKAVEGIGPKTAEGIFRTVNEPGASYGSMAFPDDDFGLL